MESQENLSSHCWVQVASRLVHNQERRSSQKSSRERGLPLVASTQVFDLLEQMLLHIEEFPQIEDLAKHFLPWKTLELPEETQVVEEREALLRILIFQTHAHFVGRKPFSLEQIAMVDEALPGEACLPDSSQ